MESLKGTNKIAYDPDKAEINLAENDFTGAEASEDQVGEDKTGGKEG